MGRLIDVDNIDYYLEEGGTVVAFKADIEQIPSVQPDSDCISRQAAIDAVRDRMGKGETNIGDTFIECFEMILNALPSAQPKPQWIPRSSTERPKDREEVMVTIDDGYQRYTDTDEYVNGHFWYHDDKHIVAWMPLPEPYKEKDNERA